MTASESHPIDGPDAETPSAQTPGPDQLLAMLSRQRDLYEQLRSLSDQQADLISAGETERLLTLLGQRQTLVDALGEASVALSPHRAQIAVLANDAAQPLAGQIKGLVDEVRALLSTIIAQDDAGRRDLEAARDEVGTQLRQTAGAPQALGAYGGAAGSNALSAPRFTDQRG